jgi:hypothetical protein
VKDAFAIDGREKEPQGHFFLETTLRLLPIT